MIEQDYLKKCLEDIEVKLNWKPSSDWKESDYVRLSKVISETSNISISPHTLKRLFGKIIYKKYYNPQKATKDALVKFLGYSEWSDYVISLNTDKEFSDSPRKTNNTLKVILSIATIILIGVIGAYTFGESESTVANNENEIFEFRLLDSVGTVPYTVSVNYDVSKIKTDSTIIDFGFVHPIAGHQSVVADKSKFRRNFTYQIPGQYEINLKKEDKVLSSKKVLAKSENWETYYFPEVALGNFWIDNKIDIKPNIEDFYYSPKHLDSIGFDTNQVYYLSHRLFKEFNISGDNFELNTSFKSSQDIGGITCYDFILKIICENEINSVKLMEKGCSQFSGMKIGKTILSGDHEDLSSFKFELDKWNDLKIRVENQVAKLYINHVKIFDGDYNAKNGDIVGLEIIFKGTGKLDYINIEDLINQRRYNKDF